MPQGERPVRRRRTLHWGGLAAGPLILLLAALLPAGILPHQARLAAGIIGWMAIWWMLEVVPLAVTALLPLVLYPICGILPATKVAPPYANHFVFLMFGGFCMAEAMQCHGLHRRVALAIVAGVGGSPRRLVLGFMMAAAGLSMWLSNTATAAMLYPIAMAVAGRSTSRNFSAALMLGTAYACNIGGMGTLVGTFPNLLLSGMMEELIPGGQPPDFLGWMLMGVPLILVLLPLAWWLLTCVAFPQPTENNQGLSEIQAERRALGRMSQAEIRTAWLFAGTALLWISRRGLTFGSLEIPGWSSWLGLQNMVHDSTVAVAAAILLFLIPSGKTSPAGGKKLLEPTSLRAIPWEILLLFGGGFALATGFRASSLDQALGQSLVGLGHVPMPVAFFLLALVVSFVTEVNSNTATATTLLPLVAAAAPSLGLPPLPLLLVATFSASCAFMLPTATPPNAILFASGRFRLQEMARTGVGMNILAAVVIAVLAWIMALLGS